ncbi:MAG: hypothetical protein GF418_05245 [Chitinivibrionales bacterium]|nr:hypothetical protein [Chitinivibrionales bacterium]MBD3395016.1 hypothetical protein [Chitinivibrionales bacterium]
MAELAEFGDNAVGWGAVVRLFGLQESQNSDRFERAKEKIGQQYWIACLLGQNPG